MRKELFEVAEELKNWMEQWAEAPDWSFPHFVYRILAALPGSDRLEGLVDDPAPIGWKEADLIGRLLVEIQDADDVRDVVEFLLGSEEGSETEG